MSEGQLLAPCEIAVRKYIPSIRASIAVVLVKEYGLSAYRAAKVLRLTPAAISNYLLGRRGKEYIDFILSDDELKSIVMKIAEILISEPNMPPEVTRMICEICLKLRSKVEGAEPMCLGAKLFGKRGLGSSTP